MSIVRWKPSISRMLLDWPDMLEGDLFPMNSSNMGSGLEVYETEKEVVVKANVAGVPEDKIDLTYEKGVLFITAQVEKEERDEKKTHYAHSSWSYSYRVAVPGEIDHDAEPAALVKDGVLTVTFAKAAKVLPKKLKVERER